MTSKAAMEGERKLVTVLFADLKGSTELLADRDPEDARRLLDPLLEHMIEAVHRYEGTVNQVMGDGIMALFGAPIAHEDHGVRACYAALRIQESVKRYADEMRRAHGVNLRVRVGVNSGEVVVRAIGSDLHMDYTAVGQTTHLAARMEQLADPGAIVIAPDTRALVEGYVEVKALGPVPVKGLTEPVEIYEVTGAGAARTRLQAAARRGLTRFVGRDAELEQLLRARQLAGDGRGQIAAIVGEAGVGKSRLVHEFSHADRLPGWRVLESHAVSYGNATSYLPVIDLLKRYFDIEDRDDHRGIREKVTGKLLALDDALKPALPALLALLEVPLDDAAWQALDPAQRRQQTLDSVRRVLLREAREQPLLLIFEDLHWIDGETQALLDALVESLGSTRLLLLVSYRREYQHAWGSKTFYSQVRLDALVTERAAELLDALLGDDAGLVPLKQLLIKRGNPFFLEETVQTLVETKVLTGERGRYLLMQPVQSIQVPPTVQVMLAARIDRLTQEDKRLLQVASVVGKDVPYVLLQVIAELPDEELRGGLDRLQAAEFVYETGLYPELEYSFKHALTHEVTYGTLLQERRRELHARIVDAIETVHQDRLGEQVERLAHHAVRGEMRDKAVRYLRQAGNKAAWRSALPDAKGCFEQALGLLDSLPETVATLEEGVDIRLELRLVLLWLGEALAGLGRLREAEVLADRLNDERRRGLVSAFMSIAHSNAGDTDKAIAAGDRALEIAGRLGDLRLRILTTSYLAMTYNMRGDHERAVTLASENIAAVPSEWIHERFGSGSPRSLADRTTLILGLGYLGRFAEARGHEAETLRLAEANREPHTIGLAYRSVSELHMGQGDWAQARSLIERWTVVVREGNILELLWNAVASSAYVLARLGEVSEASSRLREGEGLVERTAGHGHRSTGTRVYWALAGACLVLGRLGEARRWGDLALKSTPAESGAAARALHLLGDIATHSDRFDAERGEAHYRQALAIAEPHGMRPLIAHCQLGLGRLYRRTGKRQQAQEHLATATAMYRDMDMRFFLAHAEAESEKSSELR